MKNRICYVINRLQKYSLLNSGNSTHSRVHGLAVAPWNIISWSEVFRSFTAAPDRRWRELPHRNGAFWVARWTPRSDVAKLQGKVSTDSFHRKGLCFPIPQIHPTHCTCYRKKRGTETSGKGWPLSRGWISPHPTPFLPRWEYRAFLVMVAVAGGMI